MAALSTPNGHVSTFAIKVVEIDRFLKRIHSVFEQCLKLGFYALQRVRCAANEFDRWGSPYSKFIWKAVLRIYELRRSFSALHYAANLGIGCRP